MKNAMENQEGQPEIAENFRKRKPVFVILLGIILVLFCSLYFFNKSKKKYAQPLEETYAFQQNSSPGTSNMQSQPSTVAVQENSAISQEQMELIRAKQNALQQRLSAPLMVVNAQQQNKVDVPPISNLASVDRNTQFVQQVASQKTETVTATTIGPLHDFIAEGSLIHAILESATNSDLPGMVRAIVSEDSYSEDGAQVLIPRGSRLIGQYKSGMLQGQARMFMVWTRLITPSGISLQLGSQGTDSLGVAGIGADNIDRHFWERFGTASLLSLMGAGSANVGASTVDAASLGSTYRSALASSFGQAANQSLQQDNKISPTLTTYQGKAIIIFVAKDLNFQNVLQQAKSHVNIF